MNQNLGAGFRSMQAVYVKICSNLFIVFAVILIGLCLFSNASYAALSVSGMNVTPHHDTKILVTWSSVNAQVYNDHAIDYTVYRTAIQNSNSTQTPTIKNDAAWEFVATVNDRAPTVDRNHLHFNDGENAPLVPSTLYAYKIIAAYASGQSNTLVDEGIGYIATAQTLKPVIKSYVYDINYKKLKIEVVAISRKASRVEVFDDVRNNVIFTKAVNGLMDDDRKFELSEDILGGYNKVSLRVRFFAGEGNPSEPSEVIPFEKIAAPKLYAYVLDGKVYLYGNEIPWHLFEFQRSSFTDGSWSRWEKITPTVKSDGVFEESIADAATYKYRLFAKESMHYSGTGNTTASLVSGSGITDLSATLIAGPKIKLSWTNQAVPYDFIRIERRVNNGNFSMAAEIPATASDYIDSEQATGGKDYTYRFLVFEEGVASIIGPEISFSTGHPSVSLRILGENQVTLEWKQHLLGEDGVKVYRKENNGNFVVLQEQNIAGFYTDSTISKGNTYTYKIAVNALSEYWNWTSNEITYFNTGKVYAITSLVATPLSQDSIQLDWTYSDYGADMVIIEKKTDADQDWQKLVSLESYVQSYTEKGLEENKTYAYRIFAMKEGGILYPIYPSGEAVSATTKFSKPSGFYAKREESGKIRLTWNPNLKVDSYEIYRKSSDESLYSQIGTAENNDSYWEDEDVERKLGYTYYIVSLTEDVASESSDESEVKPVMEPFHSISYEMGKQGIVLSWALAEGFVGPVRVEKQDPDTLTWKIIDTITQQTQAIDSKVVVGDILTYRLSAVNQNTRQVHKSEELVVSANFVERPLNLKVTPVSPKSVMLTWTNASRKNLNFVIYRKKEGEVFKEVGKTVNNLTLFEDTGLVPETRYSYAVRASGMEILSQMSDEAVVITPKMESIQLSPNYAWVQKAIQAMEEKGAVPPQLLDSKGFKPEAMITRAEFMSILIRAASLRNLSPNNFKDLSPSDWYYYDVMGAKTANIIKGVGDGNFNPNGKITRQDAGVILVNTLRALKRPLRNYNPDVLTRFTDADQVASYAATSMAFLFAEDLVKGFGDGSLRPTQNTSRAEAVALIYKTLQYGQ